MKRFFATIILAAVAGGCVQATSKIEEQNKMSRLPLTTLRLFWNAYDTPEKRARVCRLLDQYGKPDEIWLSTTAGVSSLSSHKKCLSDCVAMAKELRRRNIAVSIQLASSIGHTGAPVRPEKDAFQWKDEDLLVGHDGSSSPGVCCPASPAFLKWCADILAMYCRELQPLTAYIDDDMRMHQHGKIEQACCCKRCLERFARTTGRPWTRQQVRAMLDSRKPQPFRRQWVRQNTERMAGFYETAAKAVHAVSPGTHVGIQNQHAKIFYTCWSFVPVFEAIRRATGLPARVRIGGGCWNDFEPTQLARKGFISGCDIDDAKSCGFVDLMGNEEENWPCAVMDKNPHSKMLESAVFLAMGGNNLTFQTGDLWFDRDSTMAEILKSIQKWTPLFSRLRELSSKYRFDGATALVQPGIVEQPAHGEFPWFMFWAQESEYLHLMGIPLRLSKLASAQGENPGFLTWETARGISREDFEKFLKAGIVVTGNAYLELQKRGLTKDFKVKAKKHAMERTVFAQGPHAGTTWLAGTTQTVSFTIAKDSPAEVLMYFQRSPRTECAAWRLECPKGRIAVVGTPADFARNLSHLALDFYRDLFDWVGKKELSVRLENAEKVVLIPLADDEKRVRAVAVVNMGTSLLDGLVLHVRRPFSAKAEWIRAGEKTLELTGRNVPDKDTQVFALPPVEACGFALLELI